ncbi:MAG: RNA polymerase sigma factor [Betaproteobacteria bacterium]|nr:MAG: RNA polymerase sigma factor [Betaproteobacteria bacterium]
MTPAEQQFRAELVSLLPRLRRFGRALTGQRQDADDLVQSAIERALTRREQWETGTRLLSWLFRIVQNAWIDEVRARGRRDRVLAPEEAGERVGVGGTDAQIDALAVRQAMERLNDDQRIAVSLVLVEGLPYREAAAVLDIPIGTLTSRLARAREQLQGLLADPGRSKEA